MDGFSTREDIISYCLTFPDAYEDYPFGDGEWAVMRHRNSQKSFAFIFDRNGFVWLNVKGEPMAADFLRSVYTSVLPAYHMNKVHWSSIILDGTVPTQEIMGAVEQSYQLTKPKNRRENKPKCQD